MPTVTQCAGTMSSNNADVQVFVPTEQRESGGDAHGVAGETHWRAEAKKAA